MKTQNFLGRFMDWCKSWPIKRQLVVFNLLALAVVILLLFCMMIFNLFYLKHRTVDQVGNALDSQANDNMRALILEAAGAGNEVLYDMEVTLMVLSSMLLAMYNETTYSLEYLPMRTYDELPQNCLQIINDVYGPKPVCLQYSSYYQFENSGSELIQKTTRFDNVLPILGSLLGGVFIRIMMYFKNDAFIRVFPGTYIASDYTPTDQEWYKAFERAKQKGKYTRAASGIYDDVLGNSNNKLIALTVPMFDLNENVVGVAVAEAPIDKINNKLCNLTYLDTGRAVLVANDGQFFLNDFYDWNKSTLGNVSSETWNKIQASEQGPFKFTFEETEYRSIGQKLTGSNNNTADSSTWYYIFLAVKEDEIMVTRGKADDTITTAGYMCIVSTALVAPVVCLSLFLCVSTFTNRVVRPLHGIVEMSKKLSGAATEKMPELQEELLNMEEGNFQVQNLVQAFKNLATKLTDQQGPSIHEEGLGQSVKFPFNDLKGADVPWREQLKLLRNNKS